MIRQLLIVSSLLVVTSKLSSSYDYLNVRRLVVTLALTSCALSANLIEARVYTYERRVNTIDDGFNKVTNYETTKYDSTRMDKPRVEGNTIFVPSHYKESKNNLILRKQRKTNNIGTGWDVKMPFRMFDSGFWKSGPRDQISARAVESPAYSVDSGGHASSSIAGEIAKILNVKQGFYADVYNRLDRPNRTTRKPVDVIEDTMKVAVQQAWKP